MKEMIRFKLFHDSAYLLKVQYKIDSKINRLVRAAKRSFDNVGNIRINQLENFSSIITAIEEDSLYIDTMSSIMKKFLAKEREDRETKRQRLDPIQNESGSICLQ